MRMLRHRIGRRAVPFTFFSFSSERIAAVVRVYSPKVRTIDRSIVARSRSSSRQRYPQKISSARATSPMSSLSLSLFLSFSLSLGTAPRPLLSYALNLIKITQQIPVPITGALCRRVKRKKKGKRKERQKKETIIAPGIARFRGGRRGRGASLLNSAAGRPSRYRPLVSNPRVPSSHRKCRE